MFTHFGITGPIVLSASSRLGSVFESEQVYAELDCKPALSKEKLHKRILRDFEANPNVILKNSLGGLLPRSMIPVVLKISGLRGEKAVNQVTREERDKLVDVIKGMVSNPFEDGTRRSSQKAVSMSVRSIPLQWRANRSRVCILRGRCWMWMH